MIVRFGLPDGASSADLPAPFDTARVISGVVEATVDDATPALHTLTAWAVGRGADLPGLTVSRPSLEDVYLMLTDGADDA